MVGCRARRRGGSVGVDRNGRRHPSCPEGNFCVWTQPDFRGQRFAFAQDDEHWEDGLAHNDSSWANHFRPAPGAHDHVRVHGGPQGTGNVTICLTPGQNVAANKGANHRGASHEVVAHC
ncbi:hypothetical protein GCM10029964_071350 [Kibdelosporangium lantanae]